MMQRHATGVPMARAMVLEFPNDPVTRDTTTQYQFMSGEWLMIAPVYTRKNVREHIYFPDGEWYDFWTGDKYEGSKWLDKYNAALDICPVFVREGAIIPLYPDMHMVKICFANFIGPLAKYLINNPIGNEWLRK